MNNSSISRQISGWLVHLFTATGGILGLLAIYEIHQQNFIEAFWYMAGTLVIDSADGFLARSIGVKDIIPQIDGALLDNIIDYVTFVIVPAFFLLVSDVVPVNLSLFTASVIIIASAYQFSQSNAKTEDNFFRGFPSYWNIVVFYLFVWELHPYINFSILILLAVSVFVPVKYVYPSRMNYLSHHRWVVIFMFIATVLWGFATLMLLIIYPESNPWLIIYTIFYMVLYIGFSLYRTLVPLGSCNQQD